MKAGLAAAAVAAALAACGPINRVALPAPFPLTSGGTPSPADGLAVGIGINDGLRGQEVQRAELRTLAAGVGFNDRVNLTAAAFSGHMDSDPSGGQFTAKLHLGAPFGPRTSTSIHAGYATISRTQLAAAVPQAERVRTYDLALPTERLLTDAARSNQFSVYAGPRITIEQYDDSLNHANDVRHTYLGILGGLHGRVGHLHLFAEATLVHVPAVSYLSSPFGDRWTVLPNIAVSFTFGHSHRWMP